MKRIAALAFAVLLSGCSFSLPLIGSPTEVHYYVLSAPEPVPGSLNAPRIGVLPVSLPGYLSRPQIVVREDDGVNILVRDFDRWGEELGRGVARVFCASMAREGVSAVPLRTGTQVDAKLMLDLRRLDGTMGGDVTLDAVWTVQKGKTVYRSGHVVKKLPAGEGVAGMIETQSRLIEVLAGEIAASLL